MRKPSLIDSSASNPAEAAVKQVEVQAPVLKHYLKMRCGTRETANDFLWTWLCRVFFCIPHPHRRHLVKNRTLRGGRTRWRRVSQVGRSEESNDHLFVTEKRVGSCSLCQAASGENQCDRTPWQLREFRGVHGYTRRGRPRNCFSLWR